MNIKINMKPCWVHWLICAAILLNGCSGIETMPMAARAGDTVVMLSGWKQKFDRESLTVTITDYSGIQTIYNPGDPAVRAVINLYPDPLSYIVVGTRIGSGERYGSTYGSVINYNNTDYDPDWWQTSIYLDLPASLSVGTANIEFQSSNGETYGPIPVEIIAGAGSPATFSSEGNGPLGQTQMQSMERMPMSTIRFSGISSFPAAIQLDLTHDPDASSGGVGKAFVVNPRGEMKSIYWNDDGTTMRVSLLNTGDGTWNDPYYNNYGLKYYKFYITGGITNIQVVNVIAYDLNGVQIPGIIATLE